MWIYIEKSSPLQLSWQPRRIKGTFEFKSLIAVQGLTCRTWQPRRIVMENFRIQKAQPLIAVQGPTFNHRSCSLRGNFGRTSNRSSLRWTPWSDREHARTLKRCLCVLLLQLVVHLCPVAGHHVFLRNVVKCIQICICICIDIYRYTYIDTDM